MFDIVEHGFELAALGLDCAFVLQFIRIDAFDVSLKERLAALARAIRRCMKMVGSLLLMVPRSIPTIISIPEKQLSYQKAACGNVKL